MYAVIGANGYLGSYIVKNILERTRENVIATARGLDRVYRSDRVEWRLCDVQSDKSVDELFASFEKYQDVKVVYLAAYHQPDLVEKNPLLAWDINVTALSKFVNKSRGRVSKLFYASTDCVYGESQEYYRFREKDELKPVNFYGHNKCAAEAVVLHAGFQVVRYPFLISPSLVYKPHFYDVIVESLRENKPFEMFCDSYRSSLSFDNAGKLLVRLMETEGQTPDVINVCGDKTLSKYDVGVLIAGREGLDSNLIIPVPMNQMQENFQTKRAKSTLMDNSLLKEILQLTFVDIFEEPC